MAGGGITAFLAQEVLQALREGLAILAGPALRSAFRAMDTWMVVASIQRLAGLRPENPAPFVRRGKAGMTVLAWLAEASPVLGDPAQPLVGLDHPVIGAAVEWLQTSLDIGERAPPALPVPAYAPAPQSPWAAIGV
jgi:hypothetical protein